MTRARVCPCTAEKNERHAVHATYCFEAAQTPMIAAATAHRRLVAANRFLKVKAPPAELIWRKFEVKMVTSSRRSSRICIFKGVGILFRSAMNADPEDIDGLLERAAEGDQAALDELFSRYRHRLKRMVHLRLSRRLQGRVDDSDVLQEALVDVSKNLRRYAKHPTLPFFLWLRHITGLKLAEVHRRHLGAQMRAPDREVSLHRGGLPAATSMSLAAQLLGKLTSPSQAAIKAETRMYVQQALNSMDPIDREVLALRHFEQLSTAETAQVLGMSKSGAGSRYLRAIKRLREILAQIPGFDAF